MSQHTRWASEADSTLSKTNSTGVEKQDSEPRYRYETRGGSAESAIAARHAPGARTLFGESVRLAGLSPTHDRKAFVGSGGGSSGYDPPSPTAPSRDAKMARMSLPNGFKPAVNGYSSIREEHHEPQSLQPFPLRRNDTPDSQPREDRPGSTGVFQRSPRTISRARPTTAGSSDRFQQNVRASLGLTGSSGPSRPSTSAGLYRDRDRDREREKERERDGDNSRLGISPLTQRNVSSQQERRRPTPLFDSPANDRDRDNRRYESPTFRPLSSMAQNQLNASPSSTDHPDILLEALNLLENHLSRLPSNNTSQVSECSRAASGLVDQMRTLNTRLRAATSSALEEHIEADVEARTNENAAREADIWKVVGGEYRESLRASDELVRTLTTFFLSFGKILRDGGNAGNTASTSSGNNNNSALVRRENAASPSLYSHRREVSTGSTDDIHARPPTRTQSRRSLDAPTGTGYARRTLDSVRASVSNQQADEWGRPSSTRLDRLANSENSRKSLENARRSLDTRPPPREFASSPSNNTPEPFPRSSTSMSQARDRYPSSAATIAPRTGPRRPSVFTSITTRRFFSGSTAKGEPSEQPPRSATMESATSTSSRTTGDESFESDDQAYESPTPAERNKSIRRTFRKSLPFTSDRPHNVERPPLPTVLSERTITSPKKDRRGKTSTTSNATVRGSSIQLAGGGALPLPTQLSKTTALTASLSSGISERDLRRHDDFDTDLPGSLSRTAGANVLSSVNERGEVFTGSASRKRTISAVSDRSGMLMESPTTTEIRDSLADVRSSSGNTSDSSRSRRGTIGGLFR